MKDIRRSSFAADVLVLLGVPWNAGLEPQAGMVFDIDCAPIRGGMGGDGVARRAIHDPFYDIRRREGSITVRHKLAAGPDGLVRLLGVPAGREEAGAGIDVPGGQPEAVHEIVIGAKGRQLVGGSSADQECIF